MVDARDLKSLGRKLLCRFESGRPHQKICAEPGPGTAAESRCPAITPAWSQVFSEPSAFTAHISAAITPLQRGNRIKVSKTIAGSQIASVRPMAS